MVTFRPLTTNESDATLWTARSLDLPDGELTFLERLAWLRGALLARCGAPQREAIGAMTFSYELEATVDGQRARVALADSKGASFDGVFGRFVHGSLDEGILVRVEGALRDLIEETRPADFSAKVYEYAVARYGCAGGVPWANTKKNGKVDCHHMFRVEPFSRARFAIEAEGAKERFESRAIADVIVDLGNLALLDFVPIARAFACPQLALWVERERFQKKLATLAARAKSVPERGGAWSEAIVDLEAAIAFAESTRTNRLRATRVVV